VSLLKVIEGSEADPSAAFMTPEEVTLTKVGEPVSFSAAN
jgi:hypothetical protein